MTETIDPAQIENELERIWDSLQGSNKMRACLFNLIIYAKRSQRISYLNQVAQNVIEKFPSRVIFITHDEECSNHDLRTSVSVLTADAGENEIVCDLIEIDVCKRDHPKVPFVILPHILPDLPIYLVHADDPTQSNPVAERLENLASRVIFDSEAACNLPEFAKAVLEHHARTPGDVADLNWARIEGWRQLFANIFKSQDDLEVLRHATDIHIHYNSVQTDYLCHTNLQAIYLQAWIACQLDWKLSKVATDQEILSFAYETEHFPVRIYLHASEMSEVPPGRIISVEIETDREQHYVMKRDLKFLSHVIIERSSPESCALPTHFVLDRDVSGQSLVKEICHNGTSQHYTRMLELIASIENESFCS